jgi:serine/threonine protein kinase
MENDSKSKNVDTNKLTQWIENGITGDYINYYDYSEFGNIKLIGKGGYSNVYRATWENSNTVVALKKFINIEDNSNNSLIKEIVNEVCLHNINYLYLLINRN